MRALATIAISQLARVEVPAAFWRKHRLGELDAAGAEVLTAEFEADYYGTIDEEPRFAVVDVTAAVLDEAAGLCSRFPLRAFDALQLASAVAVRAVEPALSGFVVFDATLRTAAASVGLTVLPAGELSPAGPPAGR